MENFRHIHQILLENGYPESHDSDWYIQIEVFQRPLIIPHWYDCHTKYRAKVAVRSLLNKTDVYSVTVFNPITGPISFYRRFNERAEHEWSYYFD